MTNLGQKSTQNVQKHLLGHPPFRSGQILPHNTLQISDLNFNLFFNKKYCPVRIEVHIYSFGGLDTWIYSILIEI